MPGLKLMGRSLASGTAQLPKVDFSASFSALGRDTQENILSGLVLGTAGAMERIVAEVERTEAVGFQVVLTGGMAEGGGALAEQARAHLQIPVFAIAGGDALAPALPLFQVHLVGRG